MASALRMMKSGLTMDHGVHGVAGLLLDTGIEYGAGFGLGELYARYGETKWGKKVPYMVAIGGKSLAVLAEVAMGGGHNMVSGVFNAIGSAGVATIGVAHGLEHGRKATGVKAVRLPANADTSKLSGAQAITSIGALNPAAPGRGLTWDQIEELASAR